jgi:glucose/mannose-6-phosphate isomerase
MGIVGMLAKAGLVEMAEVEVEGMVDTLNNFKQKYDLSVPRAENLAKHIALSLDGRIPILVGAEFLAGGLQVIRNQLHETSKNYAEFFLIPELNHHLMEGLACPDSNPQNLAFLFFVSSLYHPRNQKRFEITREVVTQNKIPVLEYHCRAEGKINQTLEVMIFGGFLAFYLGMINGLDPSTIPWVDYFKEKLS